MAEGGDGRCDALIVGGGHNGLVCAAYLAAAGLKVTVLERREVVGGAAVTEEFHPGFRNSVASYTVSLLNPRVIRDLELARHGLRIVERSMSNFLPTDDGRYLMTGGGRTKTEVAKFSAKDAERLDGWFESAPIKAVYGFDGIVGNFASPYTPGSGYVLLHHVFGEVNGKKGAWGHAIGGMGAISQAMAKAAAALGVTIKTDAPVKEV